MSDEDLLRVFPGLRPGARFREILHIGIMNALSRERARVHGWEPRPDPLLEDAAELRRLSPMDDGELAVPYMPSLATLATEHSPLQADRVVDIFADFDRGAEPDEPPRVRGEDCSIAAAAEVLRRAGYETAQGCSPTPNSFGRSLQRLWDRQDRGHVLWPLAEARGMNRRRGLPRRLVEEIAQRIRRDRGEFERAESERVGREQSRIRATKFGQR